MSLLAVATFQPSKAFKDCRESASARLSVPTKLTCTHGRYICVCIVTNDRTSIFSGSCMAFSTPKHTNPHKSHSHVHPRRSCFAK